MSSRKRRRRTQKRRYSSYLPKGEEEVVESAIAYEFGQERTISLEVRVTFQGKSYVDEEAMKKLEEEQKAKEKG